MQKNQKEIKLTGKQISLIDEFTYLGVTHQYGVNRLIAGGHV